jgi:hypothetical protein
MNFEPMECLAQTMHLSCTGTDTVSKWTKMRFHMTHVTLEFHRVRPKRLLRLWCVRHKPCTYLSSRLALPLMDCIELPLEPCHLEVPSSASKTICEHELRFVQTMHLSCTDSNTISKRTEMRFHMTHVTWQFDPVCTKRLPSL